MVLLETDLINHLNRNILSKTKMENRIMDGHNSGISTELNDK